MDVIDLTSDTDGDAQVQTNEVIDLTMDSDNAKGSATKHNTEPGSEYCSIRSMKC